MPPPRLILPPTASEAASAQQPPAESHSLKRREIVKFPPAGGGPRLISWPSSCYIEVEREREVSEITFSVHKHYILLGWSVYFSNVLRNWTLHTEGPTDICKFTSTSLSIHH